MTRRRPPRSLPFPVAPARPPSRAGLPAATAMQPHLRPLDTGEILDGAFRLCRRHAGAFLLAGALPMLPLLAVWGWTLNDAAAGRISRDGVVEVAVLALLAGWIPAALSRAAVVRMADDAQMGRPVRAGRALLLALRRSPAVLWATFFAALLIALPLWAGFALAGGLEGAGAVSLTWTAIVGTLGAVAVLSAGWSGMLPALVLERKGPVEGLGRAWQLARAAPGKVAAVWAVGWTFCGMAWLLAMLAVALTVDRMNSPVGSALWIGLTQATGVLTVPLVAAARTLLFNDLRVRAEALDVRVLTERLAVA